MAVSPGSAPRYRAKRGSGRFYFLLFTVGLIFFGGFYVGVRATRHIARSGPAILQPLFGVSMGWLGTPAVPAAPAPNAAPVTNAPASAAIGAAPNAAPPAPTTGATAPAPNQPTPLPAPPRLPNTNAAAPGTVAALEQNVSEYNVNLRRADNSFHDFQVANAVLSDPKATPEDRAAAADHAHTAADDLQAYVHRAQTLYDAVHADPLYAKKYKETDKALDSASVRQQFQELDTDNLRYIRPK